MKKSFAIIALAALVMLAGCKKNDPKPNGTRLFAGIEKHKSDSKTSLDGLQIKWSEGDQLYVNNGTTDPACFTLVSGAGTTKGEFATEGEYSFAAENNVAVYPYNNDITVSGTTVTMTLPAVQAASGEGSFGNGANPMLGTFSDMDNLTLTSLCGVLCLQLKGDNVGISAIEIEGGPDDKLNGTFTANYKDTDPVLAKSGDDGTNTVRLNCNATLTSTAQKFYVVVPADTLHGLTMKVYDGDNEIFSKSTANNVPVFVNTLSTMDTVEVAPEPVGPVDPALSVPLTLEALTGGDIVVNIMNVGGKGGGVYPGSSKGGPGGGRSSNIRVKYSVNGGEPTTIYETTTEATTIPVNAGDKVQFYGDDTSTQFHGDEPKVVLQGTAETKVYGNIMSLLDEDNYATLTTLPNGSFGNFAGLFSGNENLTDASGLLLPATTLTGGCYYAMFSGCTSLTTAPALPATELAEQCYFMMFLGCTSLTTAPELPATELAEQCYAGMFYGCTNLTTAPELPATTLANSCYGSMFAGCTGLTTAPTLPAETLASNCYGQMFYGCTSLTTAPALPVETLASDCYSYMFSDCTSLTTAPTLPATTLDSECYYGMFSGCTSLTTAPVLPATTLAEWCYANMFNGCTSLTTAPTLLATTLANSCYRNMFQGCTNLNSITCLATEGINENYSTYYWLDGVASTGTFIKASGATWPTGNNGIPSGWTVYAITLEDLTTPLTLEALTDGNIVVYIMDIGGKGGGVYPGSSKGGPGGGGSGNFNRKYSVNGGAKTTIYETTTINVNAGDKVQFYGNGTSLQVYGGDIFVALQGTAETKVYGNIMSMLDETGYASATTLAPLAFMALFFGNENLTDASGLLLPATTLADGCYANMFYGCTRLVTAPTLPAPTLAEQCYYQMFQNCTNMNSITCLATEGINENGSTDNWVYGVASTGTFNRASGATWPTGDNGIPSGWTVNEQ